MANVNSSNGYVSLPSQSITTTTETTLLVPAASALYQGLPSPVLAAGAGLYIDPVKNYQSSNPTATSPTYVNDSIDGRQVRIRVVGVATTGVGSTFTVKLYNGTSSTVASDTLLCTFTAYTAGGAGSFNFICEANLIWDSVSTKLNGTFSSDISNTYTGPAAITAATITAPTSLQFIPSFTFGTANAANAVVVKEFLFENV